MSAARKSCDGAFLGWRCTRLIDDALWRDFQAATHAAGTTASETVRQLIRDWTNTHKQRGTK